ncbi:hypothetical protein CYMTET_43046 [Cymbomonas tetramitiformis]|uniref:NADP-dependent oxidoreductase domain-containing protein n=1 Tax=Cymbomonas tetramitiformis TaxID=36881 RepID=A0AAE0C2U2_9CHLO|nr:hypothetical protein CYMTET_43046 [Cymbomonas tetramitiformis]
MIGCRPLEAGHFSAHSTRKGVTCARAVASKHEVSIANVAVRYVLNQPAVGGVIVGARLGVSQHIEDNRRVFQFQLDEEDLKSLKLASRSGRVLNGDCGDEYRYGR